MSTSTTNDNQAGGKKPEGFVARAVNTVMGAINYCVKRVWDDPRRNFKTGLIKTLNLTVSSFFDTGLQNRSMALTYSTVLSIVPAFALLVAIGRGFGLQDILQKQIYSFFPSQSQMITTALSFVDSYLTSATQGVFVGVGIVVLLWTVISLLSSIEDAFNSIWDVKQSRTLYQKITDYIAICLIIPVLMICSSGVSFFMSDVIQSHLDLPFLSPLFTVGMNLIPIFLCWMAFSLSYYLIPNTKVKFKYAAIAGAIAAIAFQILQLLFLNGQIYVSKYNAIYGSFAFLPLMLVWLQFSWLLLLTGCLLAFSMQNVFTFNLMGDVDAISNRGWRNMAIIVMAITSRRFADNERPLTTAEMAVQYSLPVRIVGRIVNKLIKAKLLYKVDIGDGRKGITPAVETADFTTAEFIERLDTVGVSNVVPDFDHIYSDFLKAIAPLTKEAITAFGSLKIKDVPLPTPEQVKKMLITDFRQSRS